MFEYLVNAEYYDKNGEYLTSDLSLLKLAAKIRDFEWHPSKGDDGFQVVFDTSAGPDVSFLTQEENPSDRGGSYNPEPKQKYWRDVFLRDLIYLILANKDILGVQNEDPDNESDRRKILRLTGLTTADIRSSDGNIINKLRVLKDPQNTWGAVRNSISDMGGRVEGSYRRGEISVSDTKSHDYNYDTLLHEWGHQRQKQSGFEGKYDRHSYRSHTGDFTLTQEEVDRFENIFINDGENVIGMIENDPNYNMDRSIQAYLLPSVREQIKIMYTSFITELNTIQGVQGLDFISAYQNAESNARYLFVKIRSLHFEESGARRAIKYFEDKGHDLSLENPQFAEMMRKYGDALKLLLKEIHTVYKNCRNRIWRYFIKTVTTFSHRIPQVFSRPFNKTLPFINIETLARDIFLKIEKNCLTVGGCQRTNELPAIPSIILSKDPQILEYRKRAVKTQIMLADLYKRNLAPYILIHPDFLKDPIIKKRIIDYSVKALIDIRDNNLNSIKRRLPSAESAKERSDYELEIKKLPSNDTIIRTVRKVVNQFQKPFFMDEIERRCFELNPYMRYANMSTMPEEDIKLTDTIGYRYWRLLENCIHFMDFVQIHLQDNGLHENLPWSNKDYLLNAIYAAIAKFRNEISMDDEEYHPQSTLYQYVLDAFPMYREYLGDIIDLYGERG